VQVMHIAPAADGLVAGMQALLAQLGDSRMAPLGPTAVRMALPALCGEGGVRSRVAHATEATEAFEALLSTFTESSDQRFVSCVERHFSMSMMEMCECVCDEMLEPLHYKQSEAYVSVPLLLSSPPSEGSPLAAPLSSSTGPLCPTANCGKRMRILRYLMAPMPSLLVVGLSWDATAVQPSSIHSVLTLIEQTIDLQAAFKSLPQPATASLRGVLASSGPTHHSFAYDPVGSSWLHHGEGAVTAVGEEWEAVVSKCSQYRLKPVLLLYQINTSQY